MIREISGSSDSNDARFNLEEMDASSEGSLAENLGDFEAFRFSFTPVVEDPRSMQVSDRYLITYQIFR